MGCMSRRVVPACGNLCFMCPALRAKSRQPVKRYKKLIANIFPRSHLQDCMPNDRNIAKLCEYASKNPLRIPKITENLEHRCYKDLRNEHFASVNIVVCIYKKLLSSSKEHMPLFASSLLRIVGTLLEQTRHDEMCILGCNFLLISLIIRLSSQQVGFLLSSIWTQATFAENTPACYEALAYSYSLTLLFSRTKNSHVALVRCFQLAFSLRIISLDPEGSLRSTRRRSLFTLASAMLIFSAKAVNIPDLITHVKATLTDEMVDPFLELIYDTKLQAVAIKPDSKKIFYGSQEDEIMASQCLIKIDPNDEMLKKSVMCYFMMTFGRSVENVEAQLIQRFVPDDVYPLGAALFMETSRPSSPLGEMVFEDINEMPAAASTDLEAFMEVGSTQPDQRSSLAMNTLEVLSVNELLESVLETCRQVASVPVSSAPILYNQMKNQCEALVTGKHQKMSVLLSYKNQQEIKGVSGFPKETGMKEQALSTLELQIVKEVQVQDQMNSSKEYEQFFRLPPSSPYDKFLKAAGC